MSKVSFHYNFKKDAWSWVLFAKNNELWGLNWKDQISFIPDELLKKIIKKDKKSARFLVYNHLISHPKKKLRQLVIKEELIFVEKTWEKIEKRFFKRMERVIQKPIFNNHFKCYLTSAFMCPYNEKEKWFMISMWHSVPKSITTICHEILHLQFLHYYKKYCRKFLSKEETEDLKEALTFLLNTDFNDLILCEDSGYPHHKKLRCKLEKVWSQEKNFNKFLDRAIEITKGEKGSGAFK